jgi:hypothetical protein
VRDANENPLDNLTGVEMLSYDAVNDHLLIDCEILKYDPYSDLLIIDRSYLTDTI